MTSAGKSAWHGLTNDGHSLKEWTSHRSSCARFAKSSFLPTATELFRATSWAAKEEVMPAKPITIGDLHFAKKADAASFLGAMLRRYDVGDRVNSADEEV